MSLVYVMYAYSGWNATTYIVGEIRNPQRNVLRSVFFGTLIVVVLYVVVNAVFLHTTPMAEMAAAADQGKPDVASLAARHIFGGLGRADGGRTDLPEPDLNDLVDGLDRPASDGGHGRGSAGLAFPRAARHEAEFRE